MPIPQKLTFTWLREQYQRGALTPKQVVLEIVARAERDKEMNIWIIPPALAHIQPYLDLLESKKSADSPLWGIPFAIKDNIDLQGLPTTAGCPGFTYMPAEHAVVVQRLIEAGAIPIGKANLDQFATGLVGTRSPYGDTHNALRQELISGGSSSGSAVAVARGQAAFALGTDTAGSGRVPAALNNLVGLKPSIGAWPTKGLVPACASLDCITVFAHSLEDAAGVDAVVRGSHEGDPWSRNTSQPVPQAPLRWLLPKEAPEFFGPYEDAYRAAWLHAVDRMEASGVPVSYVNTDLFAQAAAVLYEGPWVAERWASLGDFVNSHPGTVHPVTEQILKTGASPAYDAASVFKAMHQLQAYRAETTQMLQGAVLVMPTAGGTWTREQVLNDPVATNRDMGKYTNHCNLLHLCAVALPAGEAGDGVPFGVTLFAGNDREDLLLGAAEQWRDCVWGGERKAASTVVGGSLTAAHLCEDSILVAVCGLHMRGYALEPQMIRCGAQFVSEAATAAKYQLVKLNTSPPKPGLIKRTTEGTSIALELWRMPLSSFGSFVSSIPAPLGIGQIELADGRHVQGFVCEAYAALDAIDISVYGGWRNMPLEILG
nr:allophanate hydrolase [Paenibacillus aestuarii]